MSWLDAGALLLIVGYAGNWLGEAFLIWAVATAIIHLI